MSQNFIVIVGSGPGIGVATACHFASQGFTVALLSRNQARLEDDARKVQTAAKNADAKVYTYAVDAGDHTALKSTLDQVKREIGSPNVVLFNAARVAESKIGEEPPEAVLDDFKTMNIGLYVTAVWALPLLESNAQSKSHPCFFITGGQIWDHPFPAYFSLSMQKAAQVNFAGSLSQVAGPKGIHVATVSVGGVVKDEDPVLNAKNIASKFWELYLQDRDGWSDMLNVGDITAD